MLPISIITLVCALIIVGFASSGAFGSGAILFAAGFVILAAIAMLNFWRSRKPTVF